MKSQPKEQKKRGRPKLIWIDVIQSIMLQKGLTEEDRDNQQLKIL